MTHTITKNSNTSKTREVHTKSDAKFLCANQGEEKQNGATFGISMIFSSRKV